MPQAPYPLALLICDAIYKEPTTKKRFLLGCFSALFARDFPARHALLCIYAAVTDGRGTVPLKLVLVDADERSEPLFQAEIEVEFNDPRAVYEVDFVIQNVIFPRPGEYRLQLFAASEFLIERRLVVVQPPSARKSQEEP